MVFSFAGIFDMFSFHLLQFNLILSVFLQSRLLTTAAASWTSDETSKLPSAHVKGPLPLMCVQSNVSDRPLLTSGTRLADRVEGLPCFVDALKRASAGRALPAMLWLWFQIWQTSVALLLLLFVRVLATKRRRERRCEERSRDSWRRTLGVDGRVKWFGVCVYPTERRKWGKPPRKDTGRKTAVKFWDGVAGGWRKCADRQIDLQAVKCLKWQMSWQAKRRMQIEADKRVKRWTKECETRRLTA